MVFNWFRKQDNHRISELVFDMNKLKVELKDIQEQIQKLEIKALESRKLYHKKLNELYGDSAEKEKDIYNGVLLPEDGPILKHSKNG